LASGSASNLDQPRESPRFLFLDLDVSEGCLILERQDVVLHFA